jgi:hypothetical protein
LEECWPCPVFASFTLVFALQLRKKRGKTSAKVAKTSVRVAKTSVRVAKTSVRVAKTSARVAKTSVRVTEECHSPFNDIFKLLKTSSWHFFENINEVSFFMNFN